MPELQLLDLAAAALDELKAHDVRVLDVRGLTSITDHMVVATGTSGRHVRSIADRLIEYAKKAGKPPLGVEGEEGGEWVLVDLQDVVVHIMQRRAREFYKLEDLWPLSHLQQSGERIKFAATPEAQTGIRLLLCESRSLL